MPNIGLNAPYTFSFLILLTLNIGDPQRSDPGPLLFCMLTDSYWDITQSSQPICLYPDNTQILASVLDLFPEYTHVYPRPMEYAHMGVQLVSLTEPFQFPSFSPTPCSVSIHPVILAQNFGIIPIFFRTNHIKSIRSYAQSTFKCTLNPTTFSCCQMPTPILSHGHLLSHC